MIYILRCLCPNHHTILGGVMEWTRAHPSDSDPDFMTGEFQRAIEYAVSVGRAPLRCPTCDCRDYHYTCEASGFSSFTEATESIRKMAFDCAFTRELGGATRN